MSTAPGSESSDSDSETLSFFEEVALDLYKEPLLLKKELSCLLSLHLENDYPSIFNEKFHHISSPVELLKLLHVYIKRYRLFDLYNPFIIHCDQLFKQLTPHEVIFLPQLKELLLKHSHDGNDREYWDSFLNHEFLGETGGDPTLSKICNSFSGYTKPIWFIPETHIAYDPQQQFEEEREFRVPSLFCDLLSSAKDFKESERKYLKWANIKNLIKQEIFNNPDFSKRNKETGVYELSNQKLIDTFRSKYFHESQLDSYIQGIFLKLRSRKIHLPTGIMSSHLTYKKMPPFATTNIDQSTPSLRPKETSNPQAVTQNLKEGKGKPDHFFAHFPEKGNNYPSDSLDSSNSTSNSTSWEEESTVVEKTPREFDSIQTPTTNQLVDLNGLTETLPPENVKEREPAREPEIFDQHLAAYDEVDQTHYNTSSTQAQTYQTNSQNIQTNPQLHLIQSNVQTQFTQAGPPNHQNYSSEIGSFSQNLPQPPETPHFIPSLPNPQTTGWPQAPLLFNNQATSVISIDPFNRCIYCKLMPKNSAVIHANISHQFGCFECTVKAINQLHGTCPICRNPVVSVTYHNVL